MHLKIVVARFRCITILRIAVRKVWQIYSSAPHKMGAGLVQVIHPALERDACSAVRHEAMRGSASCGDFWGEGPRVQPSNPDLGRWSVQRPAPRFFFPRSQITIARVCLPFRSSRVAQEERQQATVRIGDLRSVRSVNWGNQHPNNKSELPRRSHHLPYYHTYPSIPFLPITY